MPSTAVLPTLPCLGCGARVEISTMEYSLNGNGLLCQSCVAKEQGSPIKGQPN